MTSHSPQYRMHGLRASVIAVQGALLILASAAVHAQSPAKSQAAAQEAPQAQADPAWTELVQPRSLFEIGVAGASRDSAKANEFSGWSDKGPFVFGDVDLRSSTRFDSDDATRWQISGARLGSKSASLDADYGVQGRYRLKFGFDELLRRQSDSYQTPYQGAGSHVLTLPSNWIAVVVPRVNAGTANARGLSPEVTGSGAIVGGVLTPPTPAQAAAASRLQATDLPAFARVDLFTQHSSYAFGWEQQLDSRWALAAGASREHKSGLKALGA